MAFPDGWTKKRSIELPAPNSALIDFPVCLDLTVYSADFADMKPDGGDLRFTFDEAGTIPLNREIVDTSNPLSEIWVRIGSYSATGTTTIWVWWGNPYAAEPGPDDPDHGRYGVWNNDYKLVSHDGGYTDSTGNQNNGTPHGGIIGGKTSGKIGAATDFDGIDDYFVIPHNTSLETPTQITFSSWIDRADTSSLHTYVSKMDGTNGLGPGFASFVRSGNNKRVNRINGADATDTVDNPLGWHLYTMTITEDVDVKNYTDGVLVRSPMAISGRILDNTGDLYIGYYGCLSAYPMHGKLDEVRLATVELSADWITHEYTNQNDPASFPSSIGDVITLSAPKPFRPIVFLY